MAKADLAHIINCNEVYLALNPAQHINKKYLRKKNPLVNIKLFAKLDAHDLWFKKIGVNWS